MANQKGYQDNSGEVGKFNPEASRKLLDEAGWTLQGTTRVKDGKPLEIRIVIPSGVPTARQESELIQNMLAQVGITLKINVVPSADFFDKNIRPGQFDLTALLVDWHAVPDQLAASRSTRSPRRTPRASCMCSRTYARSARTKSMPCSSGRPRRTRSRPRPSRSRTRSTR